MSAEAFSTYLQLIGLFGMLSLLSIGGGNVVLPEMHLRAVNDHHWVSSGQFADLFSISQSAPGPSILIVTLVGYGAGLHLGGVQWAILGGLVATLSMILPAMSLTYLITLFWQKAEESRWRIAVEKGLPPLTVGQHLVISCVGAYNNTQWMQFSQLRPAVVMVAADGSVELVRRAETIDDVKGPESLPARYALADEPLATLCQADFLVEADGGSLDAVKARLAAAGALTLWKTLGEPEGEVGARRFTPRWARIDHRIRIYKIACPAAR
mgnify:CR=1 FL=1